MSGLVQFRPAYAASSAFVDGGNSGNLALCATRTTVATLNTSFLAGDNIIIASVQLRSTDSGGMPEEVTGGNLRLTSGSTLVAANQFGLAVSAADKEQTYVLIGKHSASANPTYVIDACSDDTFVQAEAKMVAISGVTNAVYADGSSVSCNDTDTILATLSSVPAGRNVIIASVHIDNEDLAQNLQAGDIKIKRTDFGGIASNEFAITLGTNKATQYATILLIAIDWVATPSTYTVTMQGPQLCHAEAKAVALQTAGSAIIDGSSVAVGTSATTLATLSTNFASGSEVVVIGAGQFDDTNTGEETYAANTGFRLLESGTARSANEFIMQAFQAGGSPADGHRHSLIWRTINSQAGPSYALDATASATGQNGEAKILALQLDDQNTQTPSGWLFAIDSMQVGRSAPKMISG